MKTKFSIKTLLLVALFASIAALTSCTKEEVNPKVDGGVCAVRDKV